MASPKLFHTAPETGPPPGKEYDTIGSWVVRAVCAEPRAEGTYYTGRGCDGCDGH